MWQPSREEVVQRLDELYLFVDKYRDICDAHSVDFYHRDNWNRYLPQHWQEELLAIKDEKWFINPPQIGACKGSLIEFLQVAKKLRLPLSTLTVSKSTPGSELVSFGMSTKKSHEVLMFSNFVDSTLLKGCSSITQVVDIGSGKGYLSDYLARTSNVSVVGLDSQATNTEGAAKRSKKVNKEWRNVKKRVGGKASTISAESKDLSQNISFDDEYLNLGSLFPIDEGSFALLSHAEIEISSKESTPPSQAVMLSDSLSSPHTSDISLVSKSSEERHTEIHSETSFFPITVEVPHNRFDQLLMDTEKKLNGKFHFSTPFCIVGLHSCGDLTSTVLRIFSTVPNAAAMCVVGCCYHHITEQGTAPGFPLSHYMKGLGAYLGRTARMLACQTLTRFSETTSGDALMKIHWRAMLQVLLKKNFQDMFKDCEWQESGSIVGRIKKPLVGFHEYCAVAFERLQLNPHKVTEVDIKTTELEYLSKVSQLQCFIRVRSVLAACIESVILLERLLFLHEQKCTKTAGLAQLFDPEISPRCYGLVATK